PLGGPLLALRHRDRAESLVAVVREDGAPGRARDRGREEGPGEVLPGALEEGLPPLAREYPRLVHLAAAVVGASHPGVVPRRRDEGVGGIAGRGLAAGRGRARHLVLV